MVGAGRYEITAFVVVRTVFLHGVSQGAVEQKVALVESILV